jgi:hypothetical protein
MNTESDSFWAGVVAVKGSNGRQELKVKSRSTTLLAAMQRLYGGYFYTEKNRGVLRFRGELRAVVEKRVFPEQEQLDPVAWTRGVLTSTVTDTLTLPWVKKKGIYIQARINLGLSRMFPGFPGLAENSKGMLVIPTAYAARVQTWMPIFTQEPNNALSQRVLLGDVNARRVGAGVPQRGATLTALQKDAILHEAPRLTYKRIGSRHDASMSQIKRVVQKEGVRKKPANLPQETKDTIVRMRWQGHAPRHIRETLNIPCTVANVRRIGNDDCK